MSYLEENNVKIIKDFCKKNNFTYTEQIEDSIRTIYKLLYDNEFYIEDDKIIITDEYCGYSIILKDIENDRPIISNEYYFEAETINTAVWMMIKYFYNKIKENK